MRILGIETSCDETAAAVVDGDGRVLSGMVQDQRDDHAPYGGVVPEVAARAHLARLGRLVRHALDEAGMTARDLDGVAATAGPGLIGGVMVGSMMAKGIAAAAAVPYLAINHLEGHALTARLTDGLAFPYLLLLISGGHCQLLVVDGVGRYRRLATTIDDAVGEAFDKTAKLLDLGYPGGPAIERAAAEARDPGRFALPRPMVGRAEPHFSFSGLKTAVRRTVEALPPGPLDPADRADLAAAVEQAVADCLIDRTARAMAAAAALVPGIDALVAAGGVAANRRIRGRLDALAASAGWRSVVPPPALCGDNAVMIAWAGVERLRLGLTDSLDVAPRPRWPLDPDAPPAIGAGIKA